MGSDQSHIVTLTKSLGIVLMVFAHCMPPNHILWKIIYCFHMPLFFIMSGYCFKSEYLSDTKVFIISKLKGIYMPMVMFSLPILYLHNLFCYAYIYEPTWLYSWKDFVWNTLRIVTRMSHNEGMLGTFWFLKDLLVGNILFYLTYKWITKISLIKKYHLLFVLVLFFLVSELCDIFHLRLPYWGICDESFNAAFFITIGHIWSRGKWKTNHWALWTIGVISICLKIYLIPQTYFQNTNYLTLLGFAIPAVLGSILVWNVCCIMYKCLSNNLIILLKKIGQRTLWIMALHFLSFKLVSFIFIVINGLPITCLVDFPVLSICSKDPYMWVIYTITGISLPVFCEIIFGVMKRKITSTLHQLSISIPKMG